MDISARSYLTAGISLATATVIAFTPIPVHPHPVAPPSITVSTLRLAVSPVDIDAAVAEAHAALAFATTTLAAAAAVPGRALIGVVDNIVTGFDVVFTRLIAATSDPTLIGSLTILKTLAVDAWAMLAHNLRRIDAVATGTAAHVGALLTTALTGSLRNVLTAAANVANAPLSPASYAGLLTAGIATGQLLVGNGLGAVRALGDAGFDIAGIAADELTFQFDNAVGGIGKLLTQLGDASGSPLGAGVAAAVRGLAFGPALAVVNFGSQLLTSVLRTAKAGFDALLGPGSTVVVGSPDTPAVSAPVGVAPLPRVPKATTHRVQDESRMLPVAGERARVTESDKAGPDVAQTRVPHTAAVDTSSTKGDVTSTNITPRTAAGGSAAASRPGAGHSRRSASAAGEHSGHARPSGVRPNAAVDPSTTSRSEPTPSSR